jgi:nicotinamidase-related amidase
MARRALLIIDMIHDFIHPDGALYIGPDAAPLVPRIVALADEMRAEGALIVYLGDAHDPDDREFERFPPHAVKGTPGARIVDGLTPRPGDPVIDKTRYSAFHGTDLDQVLEREGIDQAVCCGVCTSICVMETVGDLANRDIPTVVVRDAVADFDPAAHQFALKRMESLFGAEIR